VLTRPGIWILRLKVVQLDTDVGHFLCSGHIADSEQCRWPICASDQASGLTLM
jgi:hypothetical protein